MDKQSSNHPEDIFVSETMSTHVSHAGLKLAMVAEDELELATPVSPSKCENYRCAPPLYVVLGIEPKAILCKHTIS